MLHEAGRTPFFPNRERSQREEEYSIFLPYSSFSGWIYEDEALFQATRAFDIGRLNNVNQLSFISFPGPPELHYDIPYTHNRFDHSLSVAAVAQEIALNNDAPSSDVVKLVAAGLAHDKGTPALGDATKKLDPDNLHEENHWYDPENPRMQEFFNIYSITVNELDRIIHNQGLLGQVLDVADRVTYVMKDLYKLVGANIKYRGLDRSSILAPFLEILRQDPEVGNIYQDVAIDWDQRLLHFTNPERLKRFLMLRGLLHTKLYQHPQSIGKDLFMARILQPVYRVEKGEGEFIVTPDDLRRMNDEELLSLLARYYGEDGKGLSLFYPHVGFRWEVTHWHHTKNKEQADDMRNAIEQSGFTIIGTQKVKGFNPATSLHVQTAEGVIPFHEHDPDTTDTLHYMSRSIEGTYLFYTELDGHEPMVQRVLRMTSPLLQ